LEVAIGSKIVLTKGTGEPWEGKARIVENGCRKLFSG
jgi:hypothetical protein